MYHFDNIGPSLKTRSESDLAVDLFKKAIELDPKYPWLTLNLAMLILGLLCFRKIIPL